MENLINTKIRILSADHSKAFQEHVFSKGGNWRCGSRKACYLTAPYLYIGDEGCVCFGDNEGFFVDHQHREITFDLPEVWDGMGLPPVGTECEYLKRAKYKTSWIKVRVVFIGVNLIVFEHGANGNQFSEQITEVSFRPIKTPEQIAAEERQQAIDKMMHLAVVPGRKYRDVMAYLYDAGYRKTEVKK